MLDPYNLQESTGNLADRRARSRQKLRSVAYVDLGPSNGGLVLNLSEGGLAFSSALRLIASELPALSFKLPGVSEVIEAHARIVWMSESRKEAGVQFEGLLEGNARKISDWILGEQERNAKLQEAALSLATSPSPGSELVVPEAENAAPRSLTSQSVTLEAGRSSSSNLDKSAPSSSSSELIAPEPTLAVNHRRALSVAVFVGIAFLAFIAGLRIDHRLQPSSKPVNQPSRLQANNDDNPGTKATQKTERERTINDAPLIQPDGHADDGERPDEPTAEPDAQQSPSDSSLRKADLELTSSKQVSVAADRVTTKPGPDKRNPIPKLNQPSSAIGESPKTEHPSVSSSVAHVRRSQSQDAPRSASPLTGNARRLQEEAAAEKALEAAQASPGLSPPSTPGPDGTTSASPLDRDGGATTPAAKAAAPPSGSVEIHAPSSPSARILPEERSQALAEGRLQKGQLMARVEPVYSSDALGQEIQGTVKAHVAINSEGEVEAVDATGPPLLVEAVTAAIHQWRYKPTLLDGKAIPADEDVVVLFRLPTSGPQ